MALYFVDYDIRATNHDYQPLWDAVKRLQAVRVLKSRWCLNHSSTTPVQLRDYFGQFIQSDDRLAVTEVVNWATYNTEAMPQKLAA